MWLKKKQLRSIRMEHAKNTAKSEAEVMPIPAIVKISMAQHIGAPAEPLVAKGDYVCVGQCIGDTEAKISAPIHSGVSGTVKAIETQRSAMGGFDTLVVIETDKKQVPCKDISPPQVNDFKGFIEAIRKSGLVGLGGASFPTHIKYNPNNIDEVHTLIVNGAECEPFITADHRLMLEEAEDVIDGMQLIMKYMNLEEGYIGIEANKGDAISRLSRVIVERGIENMHTVKLHTGYPKGAERVMVYDVTGKHLPAGVLPAGLGVVVSNVATVAFVGQYFKDGMPLVTKRLTVDGDIIKEPKNIIAPIGTVIADIVEFCGGYTEYPFKILMGGPMMGRSILSDSMPIVKNNNAILAFSKKISAVPKETACINCGRCHSACPFNLIPTEMADAYEARDIDKLRKLDVDQCMECGSCAYVCPARRPLSFIHKLGKDILREGTKKNG